MSNERTRQKLFTVFFMFIVTLVAISLVTAVQMATQTTVDRNRTLFLKRAVCDACGMPAPDNTEALIAWYNRHVRQADTPEGEPDHFRVMGGTSGEDTLVVVGRGPGLWGRITALVGFAPNASSIKAVTFLEHVETPGLGARIDEPWFKRQFTGKSGPFRKLMPEPQDKRNSTPDSDTFDQITGATVSSTAVRDILNESIVKAQSLAAILEGAE